MGPRRISSGLTQHRLFTPEQLTVFVSCGEVVGDETVLRSVVLESRHACAIAQVVVCERTSKVDDRCDDAAASCERRSAVWTHTRVYLAGVASKDLVQLSIHRDGVCS